MIGCGGAQANSSVPQCHHIPKSSSSSAERGKGLEVVGFRVGAFFQTLVSLSPLFQFTFGWAVIDGVSFLLNFGRLGCGCSSGSSCTFLFEPEEPFLLTKPSSEVCRDIGKPVNFCARFYFGECFLICI